MICASCGTNNSSEATLCASCGASVAVEKARISEAAPASDFDTAALYAAAAAQPEAAPAQRANRAGQARWALGVVAIVIIVVTAYLILGSGSPQVAYKGIALGDSLSELEEELGPASSMTDLNEDSSGQMYEFADAPYFIINNDQVAGIYLNDDSYALDNGIVSGKSTLNDVVKAFGKGRLHNTASGGGDYVVYRDSSTVITFEVEMSGGLPAGDAEIGEIQALRLDLLGDDRLYSRVDDYLEKGAFKYKP